MLVKSKIKWVALGGLVLSFVSLLVHLLLAKYSSADLVRYSAITGFTEDLNVNIEGRQRRPTLCKKLEGKHAEMEADAEAKRKREQERAAAHLALQKDEEPFGHDLIKLIEFPFGPATIGKSEGQSKLHREVNNLASLEGLRDMILTVQENQISMWEKLKKVERVVCPHSDDDEDTLDDK
ncbi:hypothetical protein RHSIM_Rhsim03G0126500 [Rhododendron simsii]|uniref:Uncharacterized protein n=1 Tax=Rhododendron simsii TaxID=118357 RepID=A0A834H749_RHOSS|nr:hypothetical protein RHSIM_Rhsim03G0126500 [Rhododendron simsii]